MQLPTYLGRPHRVRGYVDGSAVAFVEPGYAPYKN
jgi:hypothetical protein